MEGEYGSQIEELYLLMYNKLFVYARSSLENDALAEEAVQEVFRIVCQKPKAVFGSENIQGWLINTLKFVISNTIRSRMQDNRILQEYIAIHKGEYSVEDLLPFELLYGDLAETSEFKLIRESVVDGLSYLEMARARGISYDACRQRICRARQFLRKIILGN